MTKVRIAVAIATHNRLEDLKVTLNRLTEYDDAIDQILVCADGCSDGTQDYVRQEVPDALLIENNPGKGSIPSRNRMILQADAPYVLLLDDDSYPVEPDFFDHVVQIMEAMPKIGVLTFPQRSDEFPETLTQQDFGENQRVGTFTSSGSIIRKSLFKALGGFPGFFFHAYEEPDYSLRVHASGNLVVQWNNLTVRHHYTQQMRNEGRTHRRHARNEMWSTLMRAPFPMVLALIPYRIFSQGRYAAKRGLSWLVREPQWWWQALCGASTAMRKREPVDKESFKSWIKLLNTPVSFRDRETNSDTEA